MTAHYCYTVCIIKKEFNMCSKITILSQFLTPNTLKWQHHLLIIISLSLQPLPISEVFSHYHSFI